MGGTTQGAFEGRAALGTPFELLFRAVILESVPKVAVRAWLLVQMATCGCLQVRTIRDCKTHLDKLDHRQLDV